MLIIYQSYISPIAIVWVYQTYAIKSMLPLDLFCPNTSTYLHKYGLPSITVSVKCMCMFYACVYIYLYVFARMYVCLKSLQKKLLQKTKKLHKH